MVSPDDLLVRSVVFDASVLINLIVTAKPEAILRAFWHPKVTKIAAGEVVWNPRTGERGNVVLQPFLESGLLELIDLDDEESETFVDLVSAASPDDLDDGEAATLACATRRGFIPLIDERKAVRILRERFPFVSGDSTVGLYRHLFVHDVFPQEFIRLCVYDSLRYARMRVHAEDIGWVTSLLTPTQLADCPSIPRRHRIVK